MREWNKPGNCTKNGERFNFQMCGFRHNISSVDGNVRIILFINIEVFNQALVNKIIECENALLKFIQMVLCDFGYTVFDDNERAANTATIRRNIDRIGLLVVVNRYKLIR